MTTCTITVQAQSATTGSFPVTVMPGNLITSQGNNSNTSTATLTVAPSPPSITVAVLPTSTTIGSAVVLRFTITTPVANGFTGGTFTFTHPVGVVTDVTPGITNGCGGTVTSTGGSTTINAGGLSLGASNLCQINVNVSSAAAGTYNFAFPVGGLTTSSGNMPLPVPPHLR